MANRHDVQLACECGATLKLSFGVVNGHPAAHRDGPVIEQWRQRHQGVGHSPCELHEAREIRHGSKARQRDWKREYARRQELKALTSR